MELTNRVEELEETLEETGRKHRRSLLNSSSTPVSHPSGPSPDELRRTIEERDTLRDEIDHLQLRLAEKEGEQAAVSGFSLSLELESHDSHLPVMIGRVYLCRGL